MLKKVISMSTLARARHGRGRMSMKLKHQRSMRKGWRGKQLRTGPESSCMGSSKDRQRTYLVFPGILENMYEECNFHFFSAFLVNRFHTPFSRSSFNFLVRVKPRNYLLQNLTLSSSFTIGALIKITSIGLHLSILHASPCFIAQLSIHLHGEFFARSLLHVFPCSIVQLSIHFHNVVSWLAGWIWLIREIDPGSQMFLNLV